MDVLHSETDSQCCRSPQKVQINTLEHVRRYRQLESAINQGQKSTVDSLLEAGAPVNCHPVCCQWRTPLHSSVRVGDPDIVAKLLSKGANVNAKYFGDTPLTLAAKLGKSKIVDLLLLAKDLENCASIEKISHLHIACMRNQFDIAQKLLQHETNASASVDCGTHHWPGFTPLHFAVQFQCLETVEFLLNIGADITVKDARQCTPLHLALVLGYEHIVDRILLTHDGVLSNPVDSMGLSHFHIACMRNKSKIVEHFINLGVDLEASTATSSPSLPKPKTALDLAIQYECAEIVELLLQFGNPKSYKGNEEFDHIRDAYSTGNMKIVNLLTDNGKMGTKLRKSKANFLVLLAVGNNRMIEQWMFETFGSINVPVTSTGLTVLHSVIVHGNDYGNEIFSKSLVEQGADYTIQDNRGKSPLHLAFEHNMDDVVDLMLKDHKHFFKNIIDNNGLSHFHIACARNNVDAVESFLELGVDVNGSVNFNATFWAGYTPLHFTAKFGSERVASILLKNGANYSAMDASYSSAFDIAFVEVNKISGYGAFHCMQLILTSHLKRKDNRFDDRGVSLLHLACIEVDFYPTPFIELADLLENRAQDLNKTINKMGSTWDGYTPLHLAVQRIGSRKHAELLIRKGADILIQDANGDTPLHLALIEIELPDPREMNCLQFNHVGSKGFSMFHTACIRGDLNFMKYFLEHGIDANSPSLDAGLGYIDKAPLHLVLKYNVCPCVAAVKLLLKYGADPNVRDLEKNTPLHLMHNCTHNPEVIDLLISHGADVNARNIFLDTPLNKLLNELEPSIHCSYYNEFIESFLNNGADMEMENKQGVTPLFVADRWIYTNRWNEQGFAGVVDVVKILFKHLTKRALIGKPLTSEKSSEPFSTVVRFLLEINFNRNNFFQECSTEVELLKQNRTDNYTSLFDILLGSPNRLAVMSQNRVLQAIVTSTNFCKKYPLYGFILRSQLKQGRYRWYLLNESVKALNLLSGTMLPRICCEIIFEDLDNEDLRNLIRSKKQNSS